MQAINRKKNWDHLYIAKFKGEEIALYAISLGQAKQYATEHFKPKKHERDLIEIDLSTKE